MPAKTRSVRRSEIQIVREITWKTSNSKGNNMETTLLWKRLEDPTLANIWIVFFTVQMYKKLLLKWDPPGKITTLD